MTVYNFTVAQYHNYYVGNVGVLVHNNDCIIKNAIEIVSEMQGGQIKQLSEITKEGAKYFFRGTNVSADDKGRINFDQPFAGNTNTQNNGASTALDPAVAILYAMETRFRAPNAANPYIYIATKEDLKNTTVIPSNYRVEIETEIVINLTPRDFAPKASVVISLENASEILRSLKLHDAYKISAADIQNNTRRLDEMNEHRMSYQKVEEFYKKALEVNLKKKDKEIIINTRDEFNRYFGVKPSKKDWQTINGKLRVLEVANGVSSYNHELKRLRYSKLLNGIKRTKAMKQRTASHELGHVCHYYKNLVTPYRDPSLALKQIFNEASQRINTIQNNNALAARIQLLQGGNFVALRRYSPSSSQAELSQQVSSIKDIFEAASLLQVRFRGANSRSDNYWNQYSNQRKLYMEFIAIAYENKMVGNPLFKGLFPVLFDIVTKAANL